ncbi:MAG: flagellar biosynthesis anti-sigma factor FlgM [Candidatus Latescibacteria bacterium]|jgi:hypothetical protein|nr:flagellar biosynthesis anti-sigma factor FlgM [Candidatus Latescibacterota bacterium]MBT5828941.1 flagellar biosynthesis anti-sigma factor FlgM [Candidatus Latescibacterota bacterium]
MQIEHINNLLHLSGQERVETPKRAVALSVPKKSDQTDLSLSKSVIDAQPDVRMDRIEAARARMADGFYDRPEVREEIAGTFLNAQFA